MSEFAHLVGKRGPAYRFVVEEGKLSEFARILQATDPLYRDSTAAVAAGLSAALAPPTFSVSTALWSTPESFPELGLDLKRVLAGGGEWEYIAPVVAGDVLSVSVVVESVEQKQGSRGAMDLIHIRSDFARDDQVVQTYTSTIIQFGANDAQAQS